VRIPVGPCGKVDSSNQWSQGFAVPLEQRLDMFHGCKFCYASLRGTLVALIFKKVNIRMRLTFTWKLAWKGFRAWNCSLCVGDELAALGERSFLLPMEATDGRTTFRSKHTLNEAYLLTRILIQNGSQAFWPCLCSRPPHYYFHPNFPICQLSNTRDLFVPLSSACDNIVLGATATLIGIVCMV
jgi:hypothetical protein